MSVIGTSSTYDLLATYSTAATLSTYTTNSDSTEDFLNAIQEVLGEEAAIDESEDLSELDGDEIDGSQDDEDDDDDTSDSSSDSSSSGSVFDTGSTYFRPDGMDPLDPDDGPSDELSFSDMLQLMILQFQNQTMDDTASTTDMMNQLTQMTTMQAMTSMEESITSMTATNEMLYTSSLVGKEVTVGYFDTAGNFIEETGTVAAAGYYGGLPVIFFEGKSTFFYTSEIMTVGRLPETSSDDAEDDTDVDADVSTDTDVDTNTDSNSDVSTDNNVSDDDTVTEGAEESDTSTEEVAESASYASLLGYNYVDYSNMSMEELLEASSTALG